MELVTLSKTSWTTIDGKVAIKKVSSSSHCQGFEFLVQDVDIDEDGDIVLDTWYQTADFNKAKSMALK